MKGALLVLLVWSLLHSLEQSVHGGDRSPDTTEADLHNAQGTKESEANRPSTTLGSKTHKEDAGKGPVSRSKQHPTEAESASLQPEKISENLASTGHNALKMGKDDVGTLPASHQREGGRKDGKDAALSLAGEGEQGPRTSPHLKKQGPTVNAAALEQDQRVEVTAQTTWKASQSKATPRSIGNMDIVAASLAHLSHGKGTDPDTKPRVHPKEQDSAMDMQQPLESNALDPLDNKTLRNVGKSPYKDKAEVSSIFQELMATNESAFSGFGHLKPTRHKRAVQTCNETDVPTNQDKSCSCITCSTNNLKRTGNQGNVAYNKCVTVSSVYSVYSPGCGVVNGLYNGYEGCPWNCVHTDDYDLDPWLIIDLKEAYTIEYMSISRRSRPTNGSDIDSRRMHGLLVLIDGSECYTFVNYDKNGQYGKLAETATYDIQCTAGPIRGRHVLFQKKQYAKTEWFFHITLCEIEIWVCQPGFWGKGTPTQGCKACAADADCPFSCDNYYGCTDQVVKENVAIKKPSSQSSTNAGNSRYVVDGFTRGSIGDCTETNSAVDGNNERWWQVDLQGTYIVYEANVFIRSDCCANYLKDIAIYVNTVGMEISVRKTGLCSQRALSNLHPGDKLNLTCTRPMEGRYVSVRSSPKSVLALCEVQVMGHTVQVMTAGQKGCRFKTMKKRCGPSLVCEDNTCKLLAGKDCAGSKAGLCISKTICDGGTCKYDFDSSCSEDKTLCRLRTVCDAQSNFICKWAIGQSCTRDNQCMKGIPCDSLNTCKKSVGDACKNNLECPAGSSCQKTSLGNNCVCADRNSTQCDSAEGFAGGKCTKLNKCLIANATCNNNKCECDHLYDVYAVNLTCKVTINGPCRDTSECNTGLACEQNRCKRIKGHTCKPDGDECSEETVCDSGNVCKLLPGKACNKGSLNLCKSGTRCNSDGFCKIQVGLGCNAYDDQCSKQTVCTNNTAEYDTSPICMLRATEACAGENSTLCDSNRTLCQDGICRLRLHENCSGKLHNACRSETTCDNGMCKYELDDKCESDRDCKQGTKCDMFKHCKIGLSQPCKDHPYKCIAGAACTTVGSSLVCQCTQNPTAKQNSDLCEPAAKAIGSTCVSSKFENNPACHDKNAFCNAEGRCQCFGGSELETSNYTCGQGPGGNCENATSFCVSRTVCDPQKMCLLKIGQECMGDLVSKCSLGTVCDDGICKHSLGTDCHERPDMCSDGTVCDATYRCRVAQGSHCGDTRVCVAGSTCKDNQCTCTLGITSPNGSLCDPDTGKVMGECATGPSCDDPKATCTNTGNETKCLCQTGYSVQPDDFSCKVAIGESCVGKESGCIRGAVCDAATYYCSLEPGELCRQNQQCMQNHICDIDGLCKVNISGDCSEDYESYCKLNTFCDFNKRCGFGIHYPCKTTDQCVVGATCKNTSICACHLSIATVAGAICEPIAGRIGAQCNDVIACTVLGSECKRGTCVCASGLTVSRNFTCVGSLKTPLKSTAIVPRGALLGIISAAAVVCLVGTVFGYKRFNHARQGRKELNKYRSKSLHDLQILAQDVEDCMAQQSDMRISTSTSDDPTFDQSEIESSEIESMVSETSDVEESVMESPETSEYESQMK